MAGSIFRSAQPYLDALRDLLSQVDASSIDASAELVYKTWLEDKQVLIFGNGGSAYAAGHYVTDLVKTAAFEGRRRLRAISLLDNYGITTAVANDIDYDQTLLYPLESYGRTGDLAIAISASGNSSNVVNACRWAMQNGLRVIAITGFDGGRIAGICDLHVNIPIDNYGLIEDLQLSIGHIISQAFKSRLLAEVNES